jgi:hypothetical protein
MTAGDNFFLKGVPTMWALLVLLFLLVFVGSVFSLLFKSKRKKAKWIVLLSFVALITALAIFSTEQDKEARQLGFLDAADQRAANDAGVRDSGAWPEAREAKKRAAQAETERRYAEEQRASETKKLAADEEARRLGFLDKADQEAAKDSGVTEPGAWRAVGEAKRQAEETEAAKRDDERKAIQAKRQTAEAEAAKSDADERTAKQAEDEKCGADLHCFAEKHSIEASFACRPYVERLAKNNFEWIDSWYEPKFSHYKWKDKKSQTVTYAGDKIKFQNGFGAWVLSVYACDYNVTSRRVVDVRASQGRLPLN